MLQTFIKFYITACILSCINGIVLAQDIVLAADRWCPFNCEPGSENPGILVEIIEGAFKKSKFYAAGARLIYKDMPWARAIDEARRGQVDGIIGASQDDAPDFIFPMKSLVTTENKFYTLVENKLESLEIKDLPRYTLGAIRDYAYVDDLNQYIKVNSKNSKRIQLSSGDDPLGINIRKLLAKRIDIIVEDEAVMNYALHKANIKNQIKELKSNLKKDVLYIAFSPGKSHSKELANMLDQEITYLENSKEFKSILKKYGM